MTRTLFGPSITFRWRAGKAAIILLAIYMLAPNGSTAQHVSSQEAKRDAEIAGVKFAVPKDFKLESVDASVAFLRHENSELALFVAVPQQQVSDQYLNDLSHTLVRQLLPQQNGFAWKVLPRNSDRKVSVNQTGEGTVKGLNAKKFVQADYVVLKSNGRVLIVGSIAPFGDERAAKFLFDVEGREYSFAGWRALFHLIASITGERIEAGATPLRPGETAKPTSFVHIPGEQVILQNATLK